MGEFKEGPKEKTHPGLKVLMISLDRNILEPGSAVSVRMKEYGKLVEEVHIVLLSESSHGLKDTVLDTNVFVYPTNSFSKWMYPFSASRIGKRVVFDKKFTRGKSVITTQDPFECGYAGLSIKKKWRLPLEVQLHTDPTSQYFTGFVNSIRKKIAKRVLSEADTVRVVSTSLGEIIQKEFSKKPTDISVLPIYIDKKRIENARVSFDLHARYGWHFIILTVARLTPEKNLFLALDVFSRLKTYFPDSGLVVVGSGPEGEKLKKQATTMGIEKNVAFVGWQEDLASYYHTANVYLQTSYFEGYGLSLVEAGLSGLPIVSTPVGIANDFENGKEIYVCPHNDPEYMFKAIYDLVENNIKRDSLKINMRHALETKLLSKDEYLKKLNDGWKRTAGKISI